MPIEVGEERQVFDPDTFPRRRRRNKAQKRPLSIKCFLIAFAILGSIVGLFITGLLFQTASQILYNVTSPFSQLSKEAKYSRSEDSHALVRPLLTSSSHFDVRATVWLDVTQHLDQAKSLPSNIQVVHYTQPDGKNRSEAIIYSKVIFKNADMQTRLHSSVKLQIPIEPFYSQALGKATLRATFQLMPHSVPSELQFIGSDTIYPSFLPIGPRSPQSYLLKNDAPAPSSLEEALERSGININLLTLLPTNWRLNHTSWNIREDSHVDPPMFDGTPANRAFGSNKTIGEFFIRENRILLPHVRTRSRIILLKEDHAFNVSSYFPRLATVKNAMETDCASMQRFSSSDHVSNGKCQRQIQEAVFENLLHFSNTSVTSSTNTTSASEIYYYAPFLTQPQSPSAYRHHRTIPRRRPNALSSTKKIDETDQCLVPMLQIDKSHQFFEFDWDIAFSSHVHLRAQLAESITTHLQGPLQDYKERNEELRVKTNMDHDLQWAMTSLAFGDREHPNSRSWKFFGRFVVTNILDFSVSLLDVLYWYTRTTTEGLSWRAQCLSLGAFAFKTIGLFVTMRNVDWSFSIVFEKGTQLVFTFIPALLKLAVLFRIDISRDGITKRPMTKGEKLSRRLDDRVGWRIPVTLLCLHLAPILFSNRAGPQFIPPKGCIEFSASNEMIAKRNFSLEVLSHIPFALHGSVVITQLIFNNYSQTFAGSFKLASFLAFASWTTFWLSQFTEMIGGWQAIRDPFHLADVLKGLRILLLVSQAMFYPGISQMISEEDEGDL